jgi:hypothetical protein
MASQPIPQRVPGMSPIDELNQWRQWRQGIEAANPDMNGWANSATPEEKQYFNGPSPRANDPRFNNDQFSPEATQTYNDPQARTHYDIASGDVKKDKGLWSNWETYLQLGLGAGLGAVAAPGIAAALGGGGGGAAPAAAAATGTGAGTTAATTGGILGTAGKIASNVAPILGGAAQNQANARNLLDQQNRSNFILNEQLPANRLRTSVAASKVKNFTPVTAQWGGPGSGLKGGIVNFSGGAANPNLIDPRTKQQADDVMHQELLNQINRVGPPPAQQESGGEKLLGGLATGASLLGGLSSGGLGSILQRKKKILPPSMPAPGQADIFQD